MRGNRWTQQLQELYILSWRTRVYKKCHVLTRVTTPEVNRTCALIISLKRDSTFSGRTHFLVPALVQSFFMLHVSLLRQVIAISYEMRKENFYAKAGNIKNLSHFRNTRTLISSWTHVKCTPDSGPRKIMSNPTLSLSWLSRLVMY